MKVVAFGTMKGGTGKTTLAFNLAGLLAKNRRILLWDIDPQCNLSQSAGVDIYTRDCRTTKDIFEDSRLDPEKVALNLGDNMWIIPGSIDLTITEAVLPSRPGRELILRHYIEDHKDFFQKFDCIVMDTNPSMSNVNQNGFVSADSIVLVSDISLHSIRGAELFQFLWRDIHTSLRIPDTVKALVLNNYDVRFKIAKQLQDYCQEQGHLKDLIVPTVVPARVAFRNSALENCPIPRSDPDGDLTLILEKLEGDLEEKGVF